MGSHYRFSDTPVDGTRPARALGEHTDVVLREVARLGEAEIKALREKKLIGGLSSPLANVAEVP